jgi:hypothetical protein
MFISELVTSTGRGRVFGKRPSWILRQSVLGGGSVPLANLPPPGLGGRHAVGLK